MVSINPAGPHNHPARDARALAQGRFSLLLALEGAPIGRATADRHGAARVDPADKRENPLWDAPRIQRQLLKLGLEATQSSGGGRPARDGGPSCVITRQPLPPWTCLTSRPSASICSMPS